MNDSSRIALAGEIEAFLSAPHQAAEYEAFVKNLFAAALNVPEGDAVFELIGHLAGETDFFTAPASTRFHGAAENGLVVHSLQVARCGLLLAPVLLNGKWDDYPLAVSCLFHDLCKANMYEEKKRNVRDEATGKWETVNSYAVRKDYIAWGHGAESCRRLERFVALGENWLQAVRWHMGAFDLSDLDSALYRKALGLYPEVLFLHTADMKAGLVDGN